MNFAEVIATNPPRLVVLFQQGHDGSEQFQWGVVDGGMPILTLIGHIAQVQANIINGEWIPECDQPALVIVWDAQERLFSHYKNPAIPDESLVGMLETIKAVLVNSRMAQHAAANQTRILGPDGKPVGR